MYLNEIEILIYFTFTYIPSETRIPVTCHMSRSLRRKCLESFRALPVCQQDCVKYAMYDKQTFTTS